MHYLVALWEVVGAFRRGAFSLRNKNPVFLQIFLITKTQREERKLLPRRQRKPGLLQHVVLGLLLLAKAANSRDKPLGPLQKGRGEGCGAAVPQLSRALLPTAASLAPAEAANEIL